MRAEAQLFFKLCSDHLSIEAIPKSKVRLDLSKMRGGFDDFVVKMWTPRFAVMSNPNGIMITLRSDGHIIVRNSESEAEAKAAATRVLRRISEL